MPEIPARATASLLALHVAGSAELRRGDRDRETSDGCTTHVSR